MSSKVSAPPAHVLDGVRGGPPRPLGKALPLASVYSSSGTSERRAAAPLIAPSPQLLAMSSVPAWSSRQSCPSSVQELGLGVVSTDKAPVALTNTFRHGAGGTNARTRTEISVSRSSALSSADYRSHLSSLAESPARLTSVRDDCPIPRPKPERPSPAYESVEEGEFSGRGVSERRSCGGLSVLHVHYHIGAEGSTASMGTMVHRKPEPRVFDPPVPPRAPTYSWKECARLDYWKQVLCCSSTPLAEPAFSTDEVDDY